MMKLFESIMKMTSFSSCSVAFMAVIPLLAADASKPQHATWTDPEMALQEDPDFALQGEYLTEGDKGVYGAQVVALGEGRFEVFVSEGGLPGAGWNRSMSRIRLKGERRNQLLECANDDGIISASIQKSVMNLNMANGGKRILFRIKRVSPTLGAKPPQGAQVLFDGTSSDAWDHARLENGYLAANGSSTKQHYRDYTLHLEFRTPYKPHARGQQRGNSGVYHSGRWETQILDSFGLEGAANECGGIYSVSRPALNMCLPPLSWQTYDVDFTAARFDGSGKRQAWPRITVSLNGVKIHENLELPTDFTASAPIQTPLISPDGPIFLQQHANPVMFRNIWIVPGNQNGP